MRYRNVLSPPVFPCPWACEWGEDDYGLWQVLAVNNVRQMFRWIEPGTFLMGSQDDEPERLENEGPQHEVTIGQGFWLADTSCTQILWQALMDKNPSHFKDDPNRPVENVSFHGVQEFLKRLQNFLPGCQVDLPSEAEWEYSCRAGTTTPFSFGANINPQQVNYNGRYPYPGGEPGEYRAKTIAVRSLPANPWGLYEMHGNVYEWCKDGQRRYHDQSQSDPLGSVVDDDEGRRCVRGGSWGLSARRTRSAYRDAHRPVHADFYLGFRFCLRSIQSGQEPESHAGSRSTNADHGLGVFDDPDPGTSTGRRGERIQKILAKAGYGSLRENEDKIRSGRIIVNGRRAQLGDHCLPSDRVEIDGKLIDLTSIETSTRVIMYYKPTGKLVSRRDPERRDVVFDDLPPLSQGRWVAVGRMEINVAGLLLFTTNGELSDRLTKSSRLTEQKYAVRVKGEVDEAMIERLRSGIMLEDGLAQFDSIQRITEKAEKGANDWFYVTLRAPRNHIVQRLFATQGVAVNRQIRVRFGDLELPKDLKPRKTRKLSPEQVAALMGSVGLQETESDIFS